MWGVNHWEWKSKHESLFPPEGKVSPCNKQPTYLQNCVISSAACRLPHTSCQVFYTHIYKINRQHWLRSAVHSLTHPPPLQLRKQYTYGEGAHGCYSMSLGSPQVSMSTRIFFNKISRCLSWNLKIFSTSVDSTYLQQGLEVHAPADQPLAAWARASQA